MTKRNQAETDARTIRDAAYWAALYQAQTAVLFIEPSGLVSAFSLSTVKNAFQEVRRFAAFSAESPEYFVKMATANWQGLPDEKREKALALFASFTVEGE